MKGTQVHKLQAAIPVLNCLFPRSMTEKELSILLKSVLPRFMSHAEPNLNPNDTRNSRMKALRSQYGIFFFLLITYTALTTLKALTVWVTTNWKTLKEMGIPDHLTCLLRNL